MVTYLEYHGPSSAATVIIGQQKSPQEELNINKYSNISSSSSLPILSIQFDLSTYDQPYLNKSPHDHAQYQYHCPTHDDSLRFEYSPCVYMSYDLFYGAIHEILENLGEEFESYRPLVIDDVISKVCEIVDDESNKGRERLKIFIGVALAVERLLDESILNDDCVICLEELGRKKPLWYPPCSHVFHADCMATWLEHSLSCPICRCDLSPIKLNSFVLHFCLQNM
ncbi:RING-H2 finger protein ATL39-like [Capsicum chacoense]